MVGCSAAMRRAFVQLERAAASDATVLLEGETGTGKEAAAESMHGQSARCKAPLVPIDCTALPGELLERELFGHERGAFTGALTAQPGLFEAAHGGTLFLDEIGERTLELQPKLLRVLERREIRRIGSTRTQPVNVRVIAATHRNLAAEVSAGRFRADLFYRLAVLEIRLPPLRERPDDLPLLVRDLVGRLGLNPAGAQINEPGFIDHLRGHTWPGNVRELRNYLERCAVMGEQLPLPRCGGAASGDDIDLSRPLRAARDAWVTRFERRYAEVALRHHAGNVTAAARTAGMDRMSFYRLLYRVGLRPSGAPCP